ncbi:MAG TPA: NUDIX domain-containing protein, partial [Albitalea sp.]|nr:NUDIX domain-containing protein [Albitalea sp.]
RSRSAPDHRLQHPDAVSAPRPDAAWLRALRQRADSPPRQPRVALWWQGARIGSVESELFGHLPLVLQRGLVEPVRRVAEPGWEVRGQLTESLHELALAMRDAGLAHVWRDEQLAVNNEHGHEVGTVERAVVRPLGISTSAVHLAGFAPDGRHWIQQRSFAKANDPGLLDTLVGGMVPARDSLAQALARETWEEAGLKFEQLEQLRHGGRLAIRRPSDSGFGGYVVERIEWHRCVVPAGVAPCNQDGEVQEFRLLTGDEVLARLLQGEFTLEAASILVEAGL